MSICIHCGSELVDEANFCIICGVSVESDLEITKQDGTPGNPEEELAAEETNTPEAKSIEPVKIAYLQDERYRSGEDVISYIPSIEATVTEMFFFESGFEEIPRDEWIYKFNFPRAETRYINWELRLEHNPASEDRSFELTYIYRDQDGHDLIREKDHFKIYAYQNSSYHYLGWGWHDPGNWKTGRYSVDLIINDSPIARNFYSVI
jgi:hypothetical protein